MALSIREAAREAGLSKSAVLRAIQRGRLSAARDDDGNYRIDPAELFRVYPPRTEVRTDAAGQDAPGADAALKAEIEGLRAQLATMRELADVSQRQAETWQRQAEAALRQSELLLLDRRPRGLFGWLKTG